MASKKAVVKKTKAVAAKAKPKATSKPKAVKAAAVEQTSNSAYEVFDNIEKPARSRGNTAVKYPFGSMKVGGAFFEPAQIDKSKYKGDEGEKAEVELLKRISNRMAGASRRYARANEGKSFSVRIVRDGISRGFKQDVGVGIWREA